MQIRNKRTTRNPILKFFLLAVLAMISFSCFSETGLDEDTFIAYPNPVEWNGGVLTLAESGPADLAAGTYTISVLDISKNIVFSDIAVLDGTTRYSWGLTDSSGAKVDPGVYYVQITRNDGNLNITGTVKVVVQ